MHERTDARPNPLSDAHAAAMPDVDGPEPAVAARPLIEGLQIIAGSAPVCGPDDPFCELPPFDVPADATPVVAPSERR